jgi:Flp pilus assembly protein TadG
MSTITTATERRSQGQAMVEFSLAILVFLVIIMGIFDLGRGIYMYNGASEAAREIARRTSVYTCDHSLTCTLGDSTQTAAAIAVQRKLIPSMGPLSPGSPDFVCVDIAGNAKAGECGALDFVQVTVSATYTPITLLGLSGPITLQSTSSVQIP